MKKTHFLRLLAVATVTAMTVWACQTTELSAPADVQTKPSSAKAVACPTVYALVLSGSFGTPVPGALQSFIYKVDPCAITSPSGFVGVSQIKIGGTPVTSATGICDMPGVQDMAYVVTGINSNFPKSLLKVQISTGVASVICTTQVPLQDIENYGSTGLFVAVQEATSQLLKVNVNNCSLSAFAPINPAVKQYNGLTVVGSKFQAISGLTNIICNPNFGDIFEYPNTGGAYTAKYSYKNLGINSSWTMKELGFHYDNCCGKRWMVGSSSSIISNNIDVTACTPPTPILLRDARPIYDFMVKP
jgi:hypothetical protein